MVLGRMGLMAGLFLLLLKVACNFIVPYALMWRHRQGEPRPSTSLMPFELGLAVLCGLLAVPANIDLLSPTRVLLMGLLLAALSYVHFFAAGCLFGWLVGLGVGDEPRASAGR